MTLTITADDLQGMDPGWSPAERKRTAEVAGTRERWSALDIVGVTQFPPEYRLWLVLRPALIPPPMLHELACRFADAVLAREQAAGREPDPRSWAVIQAKRDWVRNGGGGDASALRAAAAAAEAAARNALCPAARWPAWCASTAARRNDDVAWEMARCASRHVPWQRQLETVAAALGQDAPKQPERDVDPSLRI